MRLHPLIWLTIATTMASCSDNQTDAGEDTRQQPLLYDAERKLVTSSPPRREEHFGTAVAAYKDTLIVGAVATGESTRSSVTIIRKDAGGANNFGIVQRFEASSGLFNFRNDLGAAVAIHEDLSAEGAPSAVVNVGLGIGRVRLRSRDKGGADEWGEIKEFIGPLNGGDQAYFGAALALGKTTLVIGAPRTSTNSGNQSGAVYIFERDKGGLDNWGLSKTLIPPADSAADRFGASVALDGDRLVVGMPRYDTPSRNIGAAFIYERDLGAPENWGQRARLSPSDGGSDDGFGSAVSIDGEHVAVGAPKHDVSQSKEGAVYIFSKDAGGVDLWGEAQKLVDAGGDKDDLFGTSVSLNKNLLLVGTPLRDIGMEVDAGGALLYIADYNGTGSWGLTYLLHHEQPADENLFGASVTLADELVAIGVPDDHVISNREGSVFVYETLLGCTSATDCSPDHLCDLNESPALCEPTNTCGNGAVEVGEGCDDGRVEDGDGCDSRCLVELGGQCTQGSDCATRLCSGDRCQPRDICGNGFVEEGEHCDDGNDDDSDACTSACERTLGQPCDTFDQCASDTCNSEICVTPDVCGNGIQDAGEWCDDGNDNDNDACDNACKLGFGATCASESACASGVCLDATCAAPVSCGDGTLDPGEACDDGNDDDDDECDNTCKLGLREPCDSNEECGSGVCAARACSIANICGNGVVEGDEACDSGNNLDIEGCTPECKRSLGELCSVDEQCASSNCEQGSCNNARTCGDGALQEGEQCDDGNDRDGDGCSRTCVIEATAPELSLELLNPDDGGVFQTPLVIVEGSAARSARIDVAIDGDVVHTFEAPRQSDNFVRDLLLSSGQHSIVITASEGDARDEISRTVTVDTPGLTSNDEPIRQGDTLAPGQTISGRAEPGQSIDVIVNDQSACQVTASDDGSWSCQLPETKGDASITVSDARTGEPIEHVDVKIDLIDRGTDDFVSCQHTRPTSPATPAGALLALGLLGALRRRLQR